MGRPLRAAAVAVLLVASTASIAHATPSPAQREQARHLMDDGKEKMKAGDFAKAVDDYKKAHDIMHVPTTGLALAKAEAAAGMLVAARDVAAEVEKMPVEPGEPSVFEPARKSARDLEAGLKARIPTLKIVVRGTASPRVSVDDADVSGSLADPIPVDPGKHVIVAKSDSSEKREEVSLAEKENKELAFDLVSTGTPPPKKTLDDQVAQDRPSSRRSTLASVLVFGGFGLAIVGLGVGTAAGVITLSKADEVKPQCDKGICAPEAKDALDSASSLATISTIGFVVAGAGAVAGAIGLLLPPAPSGPTTGVRSTGPRVDVGFGPGAAFLRGTF